mmetsp:Transcript_5466/g.13776  ORF Transcript_5466/g.13776 Transcript_5466/m.13776 type:complete len:478 (-) Transcript_5466:42-1475(-)
MPVTEPAWRAVPPRVAEHLLRALTRRLAQVHAAERETGAMPLRVTAKSSKTKSGKSADKRSAPSSRTATDPAGSTEAERAIERKLSAVRSLLAQQCRSIRRSTMSLFEPIQLERHIFERLLYKNKNQHINTKFFRRLTQVRTRLNALLESSPLELVSRIENASKLATANKRRTTIEYAQLVLASLLASVILLNEFLEMAHEASRFLRSLLRDTYFMAFALTMLASLARFYCVYERVRSEITDLYVVTHATISSIPQLSSTLASSSLTELRAANKLFGGLPVLQQENSPSPSSCSSLSSSLVSSARERTRMTDAWEDQTVDEVDLGCAISLSDFSSSAVGADTGAHVDLGLPVGSRELRALKPVVRLVHSCATAQPPPLQELVSIVSDSPSAATSLVQQTKHLDRAALSSASLTASSSSSSSSDLPTSSKKLAAPLTQIQKPSLVGKPRQRKRKADQKRQKVLSSHLQSLLAANAPGK